MIGGLITLEITGADIGRTLHYATDQGLTLLCTVPEGELTVRVTLPRRELSAFLGICEKQGDQFRILGRRGSYWAFYRLFHRPVLLVGLVMMLCMVLYLPSRVLFVWVEGNRSIPAREILHMAEECGIGFGASRRAVRSERMKNALLEAMPKLQWAGVNTRGCVAVITVRERTEQGRGDDLPQFGHIVAVTEGVISECTVTRGTLLCAPGQAVVEGQILISGYTDTGLTIRAERAAGEIYGQTKRVVRAVAPLVGYSDCENGRELKKISLLIGKKRINLWKDSGIWDATCDRMYEEYYITLPGGFRLPLALAVESFSLTAYQQREIPQLEAETLLRSFGEASLKQNMIAGSVLKAEYRFEPEAGILVMAGEYRCRELIGVMRRLQIGEENE